MSKKKRELKNIVKQHVIKVKNINNCKYSSMFDFKIIDIVPTAMYMPKKYYTAKMEEDGIVSYLNKDDILIIDPSIKKVRECGIYVFEFRGSILVRQFQLILFGENAGDFRSVGMNKSREKECYSKNEINVLGAVISKHTEMMHNLYGINKYTRRYHNDSA